MPVPIIESRLTRVASWASFIVHSAERRTLTNGGVAAQRTGCAGGTLLTKFVVPISLGGTVFGSVKPGLETPGQSPCAMARSAAANKHPSCDRAALR
jgi:hypothetical protein